MGIMPQNNLRGDQLNQVLKEFLGCMQGFGELLQDPKALNKAVTDAFKLSADEQKRVEAAKSFLDQANTLKNELTRKEAELTLKHNEATQRLNDAKLLTVKNNETAGQLERTASVQKEKDRAHVDKDLQHNKERAELDALKSSLAKKQLELDARHKSVTQHEEQIKDQADRLRRAAEGL